ncbi:hypothetical protein F5144DRAFT_497790, partial [Chaetomium tenue]
AGLWKPVLTLEKSGFVKAKDPYAIQKYLVQHAEKRLGGKMGDRFRDIVLKCLKGQFDVDNDTKEDLKLQQAFRTQVVDVLQTSADNI